MKQTDQQTEKEKTSIRLRISKMVLEELNTRAEDIGISRNNLITLLLLQYAKGEIQLTIK